MSNGLSITGFSRKRLETILTEIQTQFTSVFGDNLNINPQSPEGQIIAALATSYADLWEIAEGSYNSYNPNFATGVALSNLVQVNFITRLEASASTVTLTLSGSNGTAIPAGSLVSTIDGNATFTTDSNVVIGISGSVDVEATCTVTGPVQAFSSTITEIDTPISGWASVTNSQDAILGTDRETDAELRSRRVRSVARAAETVREAILAEILAVTGVEEAFIYENDTKVLDPITSTPANSFQPVVLGGDDTEIAQAIASKKATGMTTFGNTTESLIDSQGFSYDINFTRPNTLDIYIIVNLTKFSNYPVLGDDTIKQNIVDYSKGDLVEGRGFGVGDNIISSELYTPTNLVGGHSVESILISTSPAPTLEDDIVIDFDEISSFEIANISIVEV